MSASTEAGERRALGPWFARRPGLALAVAAALYAAVLALRLGVHETGDPISHLAVLPIALVAVTFGFPAGLAAGAAGLGIVVAWVVVDHVSLTALGWLTRAVPVFLVGGLLGAAADRLREAHEAQLRLDAAELRRREAAEVHDTIVQGLAVAKWMLEAGMHERGLEVLTETLAVAQALVAELVDGDPLVAGRSRGQEAARAVR